MHGSLVSGLCACSGVVYTFFCVPLRFRACHASFLCMLLRCGAVCLCMWFSFVGVFFLVFCCGFLVFGFFPFLLLVCLLCCFVFLLFFVDLLFVFGFVSVFWCVWLLVCWLGFLSSVCLLVVFLVVFFVCFVLACWWFVFGLLFVCFEWWVGFLLFAGC